MPTRPSLIRSVPYWVIVIVSLATGLFGGWLVVDRLSVMTRTLTDQTATGVEVYVGQSLVVLGAAFIAAGVIGLVFALALAVLRSFVPEQSPVPAEAVEIVAIDEPVPAEPAPTEHVVTSDSPTADGPALVGAGSSDDADERQS